MEEGASPRSRETPECSRPGDRTSALRRLLVPCSLLSSTLHRRLRSGCNHLQHCAPVIVIELSLLYIYLCSLCLHPVFCDCASHSHSLSLASLTRCTEHRGFSRNILCLSYLSLAPSPVSAPTRDSLTHSRSLGLPDLPWVKTYVVL